MNEPGVVKSIAAYLDGGDKRAANRKRKRLSAASDEHQLRSSFVEKNGETN